MVPLVRLRTEVLPDGPIVPWCYGSTEINQMISEETMRTYSAVTIRYVLVALSSVDRSADAPPMYIEHAHTGLSVDGKSDLVSGLSHPMVDALEASQPVFDS